MRAMPEIKDQRSEARDQKSEPKALSAVEGVRTQKSATRDRSPRTGNLPSLPPGLRPLTSDLCPLTSAFTLVELMVAMGIFGLLMVLLFQISNQAQKAWLAGENRVETFQTARLVLDRMTSELEGALATSNNPSGTSTQLTFILQPSASSVPGWISNVDPSGTQPNDQIFFVAPAPESKNRLFADLTEYGYMVIYVVNNTTAATMRGPGYYLIRHQTHSDDSVNWDFFTNPNNWDTTPPIGGGKIPIADNVLRLHVTTSPALPAVVNDALPQSVTIMLSAIDRRTAARLYAVTGGAPLSSAQLAMVPDSIDSMTPTIIANVLRGNVRTFYRTVALRNYR